MRPQTLYLQIYTASLGRNWARQLADILNISEPTAYALNNGRRNITPEQADMLHNATDGLCNREMLIWGNVT